MMQLDLDGGLLLFEGEILEYFDDKGRNNRYHVKYLEKFEFESGRKGITIMNLRYGRDGRSGFMGWAIPDERRPMAEAFAAAVEEAKNRFL